MTPLVIQCALAWLVGSVPVALAVGAWLRRMQMRRAA